MANLLDEYLTRAGLAAELGVTARTIANWHNLPNGIPHTKLGGRLLYRKQSVLAWIEAGERQPNKRRAA